MHKCLLLIDNTASLDITLLHFIIDKGEKLKPSQKKENKLSIQIQQRYNYANSKYTVSVLGPEAKLCQVKEDVILQGVGATVCDSHLHLQTKPTLISTNQSLRSKHSFTLSSMCVHQFASEKKEDKERKQNHLLSIQMKHNNMTSSVFVNMPQTHLQLKLISVKVAKTSPQACET